MAHMNPRLELASLDSILDAGAVDPTWIAVVARRMQRTASQQAAAALRRGRRAPMVSLQLATFCYTNQVAGALRKARAAGAGGGHRTQSRHVDELAGLCDRALAAADEGNPAAAIEHLQPWLRDKRIERIVDELAMGSVAVAVDRLEILLSDLCPTAREEVR